MDSELAALAASGATTLVSLMITDSWAHARELVRRVLPRTGSDSTVLTDLDRSRSLLLTAPDSTAEEAAADARTQWQLHLQRLLETGSVTDDDLRALLNSLQQLALTPVSIQGAVHNNINGGIQHGPVIQSGRISGLTFHRRDTPGEAPG